jgi:hypothetical protein
LRIASYVAVQILLYHYSEHPSWQSPPPVRIV